MRVEEIETRLDVLAAYLKRQGGKSRVPGRHHWQNYTIADLVEAVQVAKTHLGRKTEQ